MELYKTEQDVYEYFRNILCTYGKLTLTDISKFQKGIFVSSKLRKMILTGFNQGNVTLQGQWCQYEFINRGDGVYQVSPSYDFER